MAGDLAFQEINLDEPRMRRPIGATGTKITSGLDVYNTEDYSAKFQGAQSVKTCEEVRRDPVVSAALMKINGTIQSSELEIEPGKSQRGSGGKMEPSDEDQKIADAAREDFLDRHYGDDGIRTIQHFDDIFEHALLFDVFGFSALNTWWTIGDSGRHVMEFDPRLQSSVTRFRIDKDTRALAFMYQRALDPETGKWAEFAIPADQLVLLTWKQEGDNYWGMPGLRPVFKPWDLKRRLELIDAVGLEKHACGVDELHATESMNGEQELKAQQLTQNVRGNERGGILTPDYLKYELHSTGGTGTGCNESIARLNEEILLALGCEGLLMGGTSAKGNRALGDVKQEDVLMGLQAVRKRLLASLSHQMLRRWTIANFGPQQAYPKFAGEPMDKMAGTVLAELLKLGKDAGILTPGKKTEEWFRGIAGAPEEDEPYHDPTAPPLQITSGNPADPNADPTKPAPKVTASVPAADQPSPFRRDLLPHENSVAFVDIARYMDEEPIRIWHRDVVPVRADIIRSLSKAASTATDLELPKLSVPAKDMKALSSALADALVSVYRRGRRTVLEEAVRQRAGQPAQNGRLQFASLPDQTDDFYADYPPDGTKAQASWIRRIAEGLAAAMSVKLVDEAIRAGQRAQDQKLSPSEIEFAVRQALQDTKQGGRVSEAVAQADLSGKVTQAFTTGRVEQGQAMATEVTSVFYSSLLDPLTTCDACWAMDGTELDMETFDDYLPNPNCDGTIDRCRCEPVFVFREQQLPAAA